jgi:polyisoprenoid-binding protein YceI
MTATVRTALAAAALTIAVPVAVAGQTVAAPGSSPVDQQASKVGFTVSARLLFTLKREGQFKDFAGTIAYDPADPASTRVDLTVYTASVDMSDTEQTALLRSDGFFEVDRYPTMRFVSTGASPRPDGALSVAGDLTIRGITKHVVIPVRIVPPVQREARGAATRFETEFQIDRTEFGLLGRQTGMKVSIGKTVQINLAIATMTPALRR